MEQHTQSQPDGHPLPRKERERLERKAAMLEAAQEVFAEKGYNSATLDEVAARAEYGKGTLYNYFPGGKEEILLAIVEHFHDELCALIERTFTHQGERTFREALAEFLQCTFAFFLKRSELFLTLLREAHRIGLSDDPHPRKFFATQRERALEALSVPLQRAMDRGEVRSMPPRLLAHMILVSLNGAQMRTCMAESDAACDFPESAPGMAQFLTELVMDGVGKSIHSPAAEPTPAS
jgi:AcrR family transcriptional regulator